MRRAFLIGQLLGVVALLGFCLPATAAAGTFSWQLPANFTATPPGANPDRDSYGTAPWRYVESQSALVRSHNPATFQPLPQFVTGVQGGLTGWRDPTDPHTLIGVNPSGGPITSGGDTFASNRLVMTPAADRFVAVGWRSPLGHPASVHVTGVVGAAAKPACALKSTWSLEQGGVPIATGVSAGVPFSANTTVAAGSTLYLIVDPGPLAGLLYSQACAATGVALQISATGAPPAVTLTSPANGALISGSQPTFMGTASQAFGASSQVKVRVFSGSTVVQTLITTRSGGNYAVSASSPLADGTYTAQAEQDDLAIPPDIGLSAVIRFTVQNGVPPGGGGLFRTFRLAPPGVDPNGPSGEPSISANGRYVAFASVASNLGPVVGNRRISNVYEIDLATGFVRLISEARTGGPANGPSDSPSVSADGRVVAFASAATNLVAGTPQRVSDVFVRVGNGPIRLVSVAFGGVQPDSDSTQPVVSADGRFVAFTSTADNLVPGDDNASSDVFVADLATGAIQRVSVSSAGAQGARSSYNPSISGDGRLVSFTSDAGNLVPGDRNRVADVFVHDRLSGRTQRVTVSSRGREQNAAVGAPFTQISDLSADGHYVVFDSDATNLVGGDRNDHTDVFRHSLLSGVTTLVSQNSLYKQGNNDSFAPSTSADGRVTVFESFADNLASPFAPSENIFAQDLSTRTTLSLDVSPNGGPRGPELDAQLLQRPAVSADGQTVAFASGADNLVAGDYNGTDDLFVRVISAPTTSIVTAPPAQTTNRRPIVEFRGSNQLATLGVCSLDGRRQMCPIGRPFRLRALKRGRHVLTALAGDPGTLFDPQGVTVTFTEL